MLYLPHPPAQCKQNYFLRAMAIDSGLSPEKVCYVWYSCSKIVFLHNSIPHRSVVSSHALQQYKRTNWPISLLLFFVPSKVLMT